MRMSRHGWLAKFFVTPRSTKSAVSPKEDKVKKVKKRWKIEGAGSAVVEAHTKSEARAMFKELDELDRLPAGIKLTKV